MRDFDNKESFENTIVGLTREGVSVTHRKIYISAITLDTPLELIEFIDYIIDYGDPSKKDDPITIVIASYGGESYGLLGAIDVIRSAPVKINTLGIGGCFSAGAWLLVAGTGTRSVYKHTSIMLHQTRGAQQGTMQEMAHTTKHYKELQDIAESILVECSNKDKAFWKSNLKKEFYINAEKALEYGLIDEIIKDKTTKV